MNQQVLSKFPWPLLPTMALLLFFIFFVALLLLVSRKSYGDISRTNALIPFKDGERDERH